MGTGKTYVHKPVEFTITITSKNDGKIIDSKVNSEKIIPFAMVIGTIETIKQVMIQQNNTINEKK